MVENSKYTDPTEMRDAFGQTLVELGNQYPNMLVVDADLHTSSKATMFKKAFLERFLQIGIAEQNLFGISAGLALTGFIPFPSTFAAFASRRALDQIAISICFPNLNVKIPGSYVGLPTSRAGASHNCIEDISIMRSLPNMRVADPLDANDLRGIMFAAMQVNGPVYFRIPRITMPIVLGADYKFEWGKGTVLRNGRDVTFFGTGIMTEFCLKAADLLAEEGISVEVIHLGSIKPIDRELIIDSVTRTGCAVTAENGTITGGFGSAVMEVIGEENPVPVSRIGIRDLWVDSGGIKELFTHHGMQPENIAAAGKQVIHHKKRVNV